MTRRGIGTLGLVVVIGACSTVQSSASYTKGTQALAAGQYEVAATLLEEAVRLDPTSSRNHNNLAAAYLGLGRLADGWPHVHRAVELDPRNGYALDNCNAFFEQMRVDGYLPAGTTSAEVLTKLGEPDERHDHRAGFWWRYCLTYLQFRDGKLSSVAEYHDGNGPVDPPD